MQAEHDKASQEVSALTSEVQQQSDVVQPHLDQRTKLQDELDRFVQEHQTTALVLNMTRTGVAAVLESKASEKTKTYIKTADTIGKLIAVAYCLKKGEECRNATAKITALGAQIDTENQQITMLSAQLDQRRHLYRRANKNSLLLMLPSRQKQLSATASSSASLRYRNLAFGP
jgi:hypothetical protein